MVGLHLGSRLSKVNMTKVRKDETIPPGNLELPDEKESLQKEKGGSSTDSQERSSIPTPHDHYALLENQLLSMPHRSAENMFVEDMTSIPEGAHWNCTTHVTFWRSLQGARFSQCCALKVGTPLNIRNGFDVRTSKGQHMVTEIIKEQAPDLLLMAPVCGPWSNIWNIPRSR